MNPTCRYLAVEINKRTGCHALLHVKSLPVDQAVAMFHVALPAYDGERDAHLSRQLFKAHDYLGVDE